MIRILELPEFVTVISFFIESGEFRKNSTAVDFFLFPNTHLVTRKDTAEIKCHLKAPHHRFIIKKLPLMEFSRQKVKTLFYLFLQLEISLRHLFPLTWITKLIIRIPGEDSHARKIRPCTKINTTKKWKKMISISSKKIFSLKWIKTKIRESPSKSLLKVTLERF